MGQLKKPGPADAPERDEVQAALRLLKEFGRPLLVGLIGAALILAVWTGIRTRRETRERDATALFAGARAPEQLESVIDRYPETRAAPLAALRLGALLARSGRWEEALAVYEAFSRDSPDHVFRPAADLNRALCLESLGRPEEAARAYADFERDHPGHFLHGPAVLGRGRSEELAGRLEAARAIYEDFLAANPDSSWAIQAEAALEQTRRALRAAARPAPDDADEESLDADGAMPHDA